MRGFMNRIVNPFVRLVLKSRWHALFGSGLALLVVRGRRSGRVIEVPLEVHTVQGEMIAVTFRERTWWRNLREAAPARLWLHGRPADVVAQAVDDPPAVRAWIDGLLSAVPGAAAYMKVPRQAQGEERRARLEAAAQSRIIVVIRPR
jgi:hypothetical protein